MRRRLLAPLRTTVTAFFAYMRLSEEQRAPHPGVSVPLRLLRLLLKYPLELQADFAQGVSSTPAVAWRGVVPQLFSRLAHPEPFVKRQVQALLIAIALAPFAVSDLGAEVAPFIYQSDASLRKAAGPPPCPRLQLGHSRRARKGKPGRV